jgi:hypothetical protein
MARIDFAPEVSEDLERILDHLSRHDADDARSHIHDIIQAIYRALHKRVTRRAPEASSSPRKRGPSGAFERKTLGSRFRGNDGALRMVMKFRNAQ